MDNSQSPADGQSAARRGWRRTALAIVGVAALLLIGGVGAYWLNVGGSSPVPKPRDGAAHPPRGPGSYLPRNVRDSSGFLAIGQFLQWPGSASLDDLAETFDRPGFRTIEMLDQRLRQGRAADEQRLESELVKAMLYNYEGESAEAAQVLRAMRQHLEQKPELAGTWLYSVISMQGVVALRIGETDNCVMCRGESSCILPISPAAVHKFPEGSRAAIGFFHEYLERFPDDLQIRWLLNLAHMTLGEYPERVDPRYRISLDRFLSREHEIGRFRDVGHLAGINRFNQAGGTILEDFDGDSLLDLVFTSMNPGVEMKFYHNDGDGRFTDCTEAAGLTGQLGGLNCVQTDFNNDGRPDIYIVRGAWFLSPMRPSLLMNLGGGRFRDVTESAGLLDPVNSNSAIWADYDNDGWLDLYVCCEKQYNRLYHNEQDGTFVEVGAKAGVAQHARAFCKGASWIDYDNDGYPDLFTNNYTEQARLFHNNRDGTFDDVSGESGIDGPSDGFGCWAWDYDNDGWLDLFATSYSVKLDGVLEGLFRGSDGQNKFNRLYRNRQGQGFDDVTAEVGLNLSLATMGCNFADFDSDGFLDMYLGTGAPALEMLVPNRMFRNIGGRHFADISGSSGTGHLQKGHGVACGDWDRNGTVDIVIEMGGAIVGDRFHNVLFQNPGHDNHWLTLKLVGERTNRAAIGARIRIDTAGEKPQTIHRHITSGSSFGANPLEQTIGLGKADRIARLQIEWPASGTTQTFVDLDVDQMLEVTEFARAPRAVDYPSFRKSAWSHANAPGAD